MADKRSITKPTRRLSCLGSSLRRGSTPLLSYPRFAGMRLHDVIVSGFVDALIGSTRCGAERAWKGRFASFTTHHQLPATAYSQHYQLHRSLDSLLADSILYRRLIRNPITGGTLT